MFGVLCLQAVNRSEAPAGGDAIWVRKSPAGAGVGEAGEPSILGKEETAMKTTVTVRISRYKVTRTGRVIKTGTTTHHVHIRKK